MRTRLASLVLGLGLAACGSGNPSDGPDAGTITPTDRFDPWVDGADWTYMVTAPSTGQTATKHTTIEAFEDVGGAHAGTMAFRIRTGKILGDSVTWDNFAGDQDVRYAEDEYDMTGTTVVHHTDNAPFQLKLDESPAHMSAGAQFTENYTATVDGSPATETRNWTVVSTSESVTVPAGTFTTLHVQRTNPANQKVKDFWFAQGVGKVKETGEDEDKVLTAYTIPGT